jgi:hypothetical protein
LLEEADDLLHLHLHPFSCINFLAGNAQAGYGYAAATTNSGRKQSYWLDIGIAVDVIEICRPVIRSCNEIKHFAAPERRKLCVLHCVLCADV